MNNVLKSINLKGLGEKYSGKVRDFYIVDDKRILITTDRISAFDRILGYIPYKGQILTLLSAYWFRNTRHIIPNHMISIPHPNVMIAKNCTLIPIEMIVRGYMTGVTVTSIWSSYQRGEREIYGISFPDGLQKNQKLPTPVITPTYHGDITGKGGHDTRLSKDIILREGITLSNGKRVSKKIYSQMERVALKLFSYGTKICEDHGLILVDTKYEFGLFNDDLLLVDEIHTPDSSRFWIKDTFKERVERGDEPENFDKEFLRLWYKEHGYTGDGIPPKMPPSFIKKVSDRYIQVYEKITGNQFIPSNDSIQEAIQQSV